MIAVESIVTCGMCGLLQRVDPLPPGTSAECARCGSVLARRTQGSLDRTAALTLAALVLYIPANLYPILVVNYRGVYSESTVWDGTVRLFQEGQWLVAAIVFAASILVPLLKLMGLLFLVLTTKYQFQGARRVRTRIFQIISVIGPWAMLDVFLLAILVALVRLGRIATTLPGPGLLAFTCVVVLTILASASFEPRAIWQNQVPSK